jgi:hypothetical protein
VGFQIVGLQIHFAFEDDELFLQAFSIRTHVMVFAEVVLQRGVIEIVLGITSFVPSITDVTSLVLLSAVGVEFVVAVEALLAEAAQRMAPEAALVGGAGLVVALFLVPPQLFLCEKLMLVGKDLLISRTQVAHNLLVYGAYMAMEVWPAQTGNVAVWVGAVVSQQQHGVFANLRL